MAEPATSPASWTPASATCSTACSRSPFRPWADRVPSTGSADLDRYLRELAEAMDDRIRRLGEHAAATQPPWARQALGPVPADPVARLDWEQRASLVAAYRERYGYAHPADPIGPAPAKTSPEARAAWHAALGALGRVDGIDLRACTDGELWLRRSTYERETAWAPPHVAEELRLVRIAERDAHVNAVRAEHEGRAATTTRPRPGTSNSPGSGGPWKPKPPPKPASSPPSKTPGADGKQSPSPPAGSPSPPTSNYAAATPACTSSRCAPIPPKPTASPAPPIRPRPPALTASRNWPNTRPATGAQADAELALGLTMQAAHEQIPEQVLRIRQNASIAQARLDDLAHLPLPGTDADDLSPGPGLADRGRARARRRAPAAAS